MRKKTLGNIRTVAIPVLLLMLAISLVSCSSQGIGEESAHVALIAETPAITSISSDPTLPPSTTVIADTATTAYLTTTTGQTTTTSIEESGALSWDEALDHVGEEVAIQGPVVGTKWAESSNGAPTFLNIGRDYPDPDRLTVVIWGDNRGSFSGPPEELYMGKTIRITGVIDLYNGAAQIEVANPSQIEVR